MRTNQPGERSARSKKDEEELMEEVDTVEERLDRRRCMKSSAELFSILVRYTSAEAATVVKTAKYMDGVEA